MGILNGLVGIGKTVGKVTDQIKNLRDGKNGDPDALPYDAVMQYKFYTAYGKPGTDSWKKMQKKLKKITPKSANYKKSTKDLLKNEINTVSEYELEGTGVHFIDEPDNKYDPGAIRIEIDGLGDAGYVPKKKQRSVKMYRTGARKDKLIGIRYLIFGGDTRHILDEKYGNSLDEDDDNDDFNDSPGSYSIRIIFDYID